MLGLVRVEQGWIAGTLWTARFPLVRFDELSLPEVVEGAVGVVELCRGLLAAQGTSVLSVVAIMSSLVGDLGTSGGVGSECFPESKSTRETGTASGASTPEHRV